MKQVIQQKYDKQDLQLLNTESFDGRIIVVNSVNQVDKAANFLGKQKLLGIDTETKPSFRKGQVNKVAILQLATEDTAFIFQLKFIGLPDSLIQLLENNNVAKVGLSLKDDILMLGKRRSFKPANFIDLQSMVKDIGIQDMSLQKIYANLFGKKISKRKQLSNWSLDILDEGQKKYAALDAVACIRIYKKITQLKQTNDFILEETHEENNL